MDEELRLYLVVRTDLEMPLGKALAQSGHAFIGVVEVAREMAFADLDPYLNSTSHAKIAVRAKSLAALERAADECRALGLPVYVVQDAGRTVFPEPTVTCMAVGPVRRPSLPPFMQRFTLLP